MHTLLDIVGSSFISGAVILSVLGLNGSVTNASFQNNLEIITQENVAALANMIEHDFYKVGYGANLSSPTPKLPIIYADSDKIVFRSDIDRNGKVDEVTYFCDRATVTVGERSRSERTLFRFVNTPDDIPIYIGVTKFALSYYDENSRLLTPPSPRDSASLARIRTIKLEMQLESPYTTEENIAATYWQKYVSPKNIRLLK
ncbi:MAG TPA: hypothetical protein VII11_05025 [Bacteroidota bacterium]